MLQVIDLRGRELSAAMLEQVLPRAQFDMDKAVAAVTPIMDDVKARGKAAIEEASKRFDGIVPQCLRVDADEILRSVDSLDPKVKEALQLSIRHNREGHRQQMPKPSSTTIIPGGTITQRWIPVSRVGLYVPGGLAVYPSSVIMNVVAAQVAGVSSIAVASPPQKQFDGQVHPTILAACELLGVSEVYAVGGAQAIAAFAYGVDEIGCDKVDVITGPGNIYVAAAKRVASSVCGIDAEAGTTEIAIIADGSARADFVAADLLSQAEHDPAAASVLITPDSDFASEVDSALTQQVALTKHRQRAQTALRGSQSAIVLVDDLDHCVKVANAYGAEHLEIQTRNDDQIAEQITCAGAIFVGAYSPVSLGDYLAGSNHVLPTAGTARYSAGLSVMAYIKPVQQIHYNRDALTRLAQPIHNLAYSEDLPAHAHAVDIRCQ